MAVAERSAVPPYAIAVVNDIIWYNESNQRPDALVRFDPKTEKFQSWAIPSGVGIIRHMTRVARRKSRDSSEQHESDRACDDWREQ